jgi:hypothetical protein
MVYAGTIMEIDKNKTYLMTMDLEMVTIKTKPDYFVGKSISFTKKDRYFDINFTKMVSSPRILLIAAAMLIILTSAIMAIVLGPAKKDADKFDKVCAAVISIDINPSVEIEVNKDNKIIKVISKNEDGELVLEKLDLESMDLKDGVQKIINQSDILGFIKKDSDVILISGVASNPDDTTEYEETLKNILASMEEKDDEKIIMTLYIEDKDILKEAKANKLSIGKQYLLNYANKKNMGITADDIRELTLTNILEKIDIKEIETTVAETSSSLVAESETATSVTGESTSNKETEKVTAVTTKTTDITYKLNAKTDANGVSLSWTKAPKSEGFSYYKIVASKKDSTPMYPENGYAIYISNISELSTYIATNSSYNNGDFSSFTGGENYYFSITYCYKDNKFASNTSTVKMPVVAQEEVKTEEATTKEAATKEVITYPSINPTISVSGSGDTINTSWTSVPADTITVNGVTYQGFKGYKVVASDTVQNPVYPDNGYLEYITDKQSNNYAVSISNKSLKSGTKYYFAITYLFDNGKFTSNTATYTTPVKETTAAASINPVLSVAKSGSELVLNWTPLTSSTVTYNGKEYSGFNYYKIVSSISDSTPSYSENGYTEYFSNKAVSSSKIYAGKGYTGGDFDSYTSQTAYYIAVTYVFNNGRFTSNVIQYVCP